MGSVPAAKQGVMGLAVNGYVSLRFSHSHQCCSATRRGYFVRSLTQETGELLSKERHIDRRCECGMDLVFAGEVKVVQEEEEM